MSSSYWLTTQTLTLVLLQATAQAQAPDAGASTYVLGPQDQIFVKVLELEEIGDKPLRVDDEGNLTLPMIGTVHAGKRSVRELEQDLRERYLKFVREPQVTVTLVEMRSQPVSVIGLVNNPGVHQLQGRKTLIEMLSLAGGLKNEAGHHVKITRRLKDWGPIPLPKTITDPSGEFSIAEVELKGMLEAHNPEENIAIRPNDVISVPRAEVVYVIGEVRKPGGYVLGHRETVSVLQALALAEGLDRTAAAKDAKILRVNPATSKRVEIPVNVKQIMAGKAGDVSLQGEDVLFMPGSVTRRASWRLLESALQLGTGVVIYRR